jgi:hypothetical protein
VAGGLGVAEALDAASTSARRPLLVSAIGAYQRMELLILGPVEARDDGRTVALAASAEWGRVVDHAPWLPTVVR